MVEKCIECGEPATYIRSTQFAGDHPYCSYHAEKQSDFYSQPDSYSYWYKIEEELEPSEIDIEQSFNTGNDPWDNWKPIKDIQ